MPSTTLLALLAGATIGAGLWLILYQLLPSYPALGHALARLDGTTPQQLATLTPTSPDLSTRLGRRLTTAGATTTPQQASDLAVTMTDPARWMGERLLHAAAGFLILPALTTAAAFAGVQLPVVVPVGLTLALGAAGFLLPALKLRTNARAARLEFARAVCVYVDLIAMQRTAGVGTYQSMLNAASVAKAWPFGLILAALERASLDGTPAWDGLESLSVRLQVSELAELAKVMRLAGEQSANIYTLLRAASASIRGSMLAAEHEHANAISDSMVVPVALCASTLIVIGMAPGLLSLAGITS
jgi:hypothetical protein